MDNSGESSDKKLTPLPSSKRSRNFDVIRSLATPYPDVSFASRQVQQLLPEVKIDQGQINDVEGVSISAGLASADIKGKRVVDKVNQLPKDSLDPDDSIVFNNRYESKIKKVGDHAYKIKTRLRNNSEFIYKNVIIINKGEIIAVYNWKDKDILHGGEGALYNTAIIYNQLLLALREDNSDFSKFKYTAVKIDEIYNSQARDTLELLAPQPGKYQFKRGTVEFNAAISIPVAFGALYLGKQYPSTLGNKEPTEVEIWLNNGNSFDITILMDDVN